MVRRTLAVGVLVGTMLGVPAASAAKVAQPRDVINAAARLTRAPSAVRLPRLPAHPVKALIRAVNTDAATLGIHARYGKRIRRAHIPRGFAGRLAILVQAVNACRAATTNAKQLRCARLTSDAAAGVVRGKAPPFGDVDAWPALHIDGDGGRNVYRHDYAVLIDRGGDDVYDNNAGGNLVDVTRGPKGSQASLKEPAIGCEQVQGNFPAPSAAGHDCIAAPQVALIDKGTFGRSSDDVYGLFRRPRAVDNYPPSTGPRTVDGDCTNSPLVRRMVLEGSGFEGNGLLIDSGGNDSYRGKTAAQGSGHVGGIGILRDLGKGNDRYVAIRNSQGFALVGQLGVLKDDGGNDRYLTYMPAPKDSLAPYQTLGSGGVIDDTGKCDNLPRMVQGAGLLGGGGYLVDRDGRDLYDGAPSSTQPFSPGLSFYHSSQGFGCSGGGGLLRDFGGDRDVYRRGPVDRADGRMLYKAEATCLPAAPGLSYFQDDGP